MQEVIMKALKIQHLMGWITKLAEASPYAADLLKDHTEERVNKMTSQELEDVLNLVKAVYTSAYRTGYDDGKTMAISLHHIGEAGKNLI